MFPTRIGRRGGSVFGHRRTLRRDAVRPPCGGGEVEPDHAGVGQQLDAVQQTVFAHGRGPPRVPEPAPVPKARQKRVESFLVGLAGHSALVVRHVSPQSPGSVLQARRVDGQVDRRESEALVRPGPGSSGASCAAAPPSPPPGSRSPPRPGSECWACRSSSVSPVDPRHHRGGSGPGNTSWAVESRATLGSRRT
jgi:hypothetical protein